MRITSCPNSCKRCFFTIPLAIPVVRAYNSGSAELRLTVCCVRDCAVSVAFLHCTTPPLVLLHVVTWPAQSLCTLSRTEEICLSRIERFALGTLFGHLAMRFSFISSLSVGTRDLSCCFLDAEHDVCSLLAHVQQFSHNCSFH